ncbi:unannotated protein [freshwater metagenome]|uniref:Unannotated protein n=1 Tax=freshwater metagenome TaxID=449393 RepID=A0A6J6FK61_9ZZZZ
MCSAGRHHLDSFARAERSVHDAHVGDDTAIGVIDGVKDHGARRRGRVSARCGKLLNDSIQQFVDTDARFARYAHDVIRVAADEGSEFLRVFFGISRWKIDLVEYGDDFEVVLER